MQYQDILQHAIYNTAAYSRNRSSNDLLSVFGLLSNIILAAKRADNETLNPCRKLLTAILNMPAPRHNTRYMGVQIRDTQYAIETLLCDEKKRVLVGFSGYTYDDLLQYLEICKRAYYSRFETSESLPNYTTYKPIEDKPREEEKPLVDEHLEGNRELSTDEMMARLSEKWKVTQKAKIK